MWTYDIFRAPERATRATGAKAAADARIARMAVALNILLVIIDFLIEE